MALFKKPTVEWPLCSHIGIEEALSGGFVYDSILVEFLRDGAGVTGSWNIFHIHLTFHAQLCRGIIRFRAVEFLGGSRAGTISQSAKDTIQRGGMTGIALGRTKFSVKFTDREVGITAKIIPDPFEFLLGMCIRMFGKGSVSFIE